LVGGSWPHPTGGSIIAARSKDADVVIEVIPSSDEAEEQLGLDIHNIVWPTDRHTIDEERSYRASLRDIVDVIVRIDGAVTGSAVGAIQPWSPDVVFATVSVLHDHRRRGAGNAAYETISAWGGARGLESIETVVATDDPESFAFAQRRGFVERTRELGFALDVTRIEPPSVETPDGIEIVSWAERPDRARGVYEVALEAIPDIPGGEDERVEPFDDWLAHDMMGPSDRPDATFLALAGDEVIGYAKFSLSAAEPTSAFHELTAVKRAWRGRGVARALKARQISWAKANGYVELSTRNEQRNAPIRRLNEALGYRPSVGRVCMRGPLATE
jgi:mycothiol synthase